MTIWRDSIGIFLLTKLMTNFFQAYLEFFLKLWLQEESRRYTYGYRRVQSQKSNKPELKKTFAFVNVHKYVRDSSGFCQLAK